MNHEFACAKRCKELGIRNVDLCRWALTNGEFSIERGSHPCFTHIPFIYSEDNFATLFKLGYDSSDSDKYSIRELLRDFNFEISELMGEFQFAFIIFWFGKVVGGADHWMRIIHFFCSLSAYVLQQKCSYIMFLTAWKTQLELVSVRFFDEYIKANRFLMQVLPLLYRNIEADMSPELTKRMCEICDLFYRKFHYNIAAAQ